ncbi:MULTISPECIES: PTS sugar transporter subunit IIB [Terribacillus]|jgi:cellobiose PTS system EIIB component|uniref:PTS sugar transporter subunit IIB n=1 Tax=Terribacillus saccharophilus TaxID=361277 RepID=A0A268AB67_9BACI|nr:MULTISPECIES: PTS sugar transporter subunit IIB [Terribacillus]PAD21373.1 PTS sugar transporter subunit IIB [Terribacillus saccharophilus]PAD35801.1 PTS sugar transporter subunit IIB [Terribacillus saccharophilus]PAD96328.1 PTS sugar transporter subunit IIB [Terribacillus saccharophilus]PAD99903.1 PTS sugar transporter subunit IIB [Terribacillus saccharophilus]PAE07454.1 PTS sugar transporter subunit IIB [Terribacillus saccharophilus]
MKRILLACSAGMSTSMVVSKMKKAADALGGEEYYIYAIPEGAIEEELQAHHDEVVVIMLGPQVRFAKRATEKRAAPYGIPVDVMDVKLYGTADGEKLLEKALQLASQRQ